MNKNVEVLIRELLRDEYDAVASYEEAILNANNPNVEKVLKDIKEEEIVHIGELQELLYEIGINDDALIMQGAEEAEEHIHQNTVEELNAISKSTQELLDVLKEFE